MVDVPAPEDIVNLKSQQTIGETDNGRQIDKLELEVYAANPQRAKTRGRVWVRKEVPFARNFFDPQSTEQSTLTEFFTDSFDLEYHDVEILVIRS